MAAQLVPVRRTLPAEFEKTASLVKIEFDIEKLLKIAAATALTGPAGGALEFARQSLGSPNAHAHAMTLFGATGAANNLLEIFKTIDNFIGDQQVEALEKIAAALGQASDAPKIDPTAVATSLMEIRRGVARPPAVTDPPGTPVTYLVDCVCSKKKVKAVEWTITGYPQSNKRHTLRSGEDFALSMGYMFWTINKKRIPERNWLSGKYTLTIAPYEECDGYEYYLYPGVYAVRKDVVVEIAGCT